MSSHSRSIWVPDDVWEAAKALAREQGTSPGEVCVHALRQFTGIWAPLPTKRLCRHCGSSFTPVRSDHVYCCQECRLAACDTRRPNARAARGGYALGDR